MAIENTEIERKFLVRDTSWRTIVMRFELIQQGYLSTQTKRTARIRLCTNQANKTAFLTVKGGRDGITRLEFEYEIPALDAAQMLADLCEKPIIEKTRHLIAYQDAIWVVDEFHGENEGLVIAEIELASAHQEFELPAWVGADVSDDPRYHNSYLVQHPYQSWNRTPLNGISPNLSASALFQG